MAKRTASTAGTTPKRVKLDQQASLSSFFSPPKPIVGSTSRSFEDSDAAFARDLAKREGIDLGAVRKEEKAREMANKKRKVVATKQEDSDSDDMIIMESVPTSKVPEASTSKLPAPTSSVKLEASPPPKPTTAAAGFFLKSRSAAASSTTSSSFTAAVNTASSILSKSLDTPLYSFNPKLDVNTSNWPKGRVPYAFLTQAFVLISGTKSRLTIVRVLTNLLRAVIELDPDSLLQVIYLTTNRLGPPHERDLDLGIGSAVLSSAIKEISGINSATLKALSNKLGDSGDIALAAKQSVRLLMPPPPLVCHTLYTTLFSLTKLKGSGSQATKTSIVKKLLISAQGEEVRYVVRTLVQNLRIGAVRLTLGTALARAFCYSRPPANIMETPSDEFWVQEVEREQLNELEDKKDAKGKGKGKSKISLDLEELERSIEGRLTRAEVLVRRVYSRHPDYGHLVKALLEDGLVDLNERVPLVVGTPLQPMLGSITRSLTEVYTRLGSRPFVSEAKLDGQRGQIHVALEAPIGESGRGTWYDPTQSGGEGKRIWVRLFSRHLEDQTDKYPDMFPTLSAIMERESQGSDPLTSFIIDAEIVAIDPITGAFKSFQELSYRSRKDVEVGDIKIRVGVYAFDLMYLNGRDLLSEPFRRRRNLLRSIFTPVHPADGKSAKWELVPSSEDNDPEDVQNFFQECLKIRCEGIMVKLLDHAEVDIKPEDIAGDDFDMEENKPSIIPLSPRKGRKKQLPASYEPDKRADSWLKVKKDYLESIGDSLDLVPIAAWHGSGRKAGWWSPILLGCYDQELGTYTAVTKIISGFTDQFYKDLNVRYALGGDSTSKMKYPNIEAGSVKPAIWFEPKEVWEIRAADFTLSPVYPAALGLVSAERGISVRFPRFIKLRDPADKGVEDATSAEQLAEMYRTQGEHGGTGEAAGDEEEEEE